MHGTSVSATPITNWWKQDENPAPLRVAAGSMEGWKLGILVLEEPQ
jgi:hypothetical protein